MTPQLHVVFGFESPTTLNGIPFLDQIAEPARRQPVRFLASARPSSGVIFMRYPATAQSSLAQDLLTLVTRHRDYLLSQFVVTQPGRARISHLP